MATGTTPIETGMGEIYAQTAVNFGAARPASLGLGEVWNAINAAILNFTPPSGSDIYLAPAGATAQSIPRTMVSSAAEALGGTGVLVMQAIFLPQNTVVNNLNWVAGTTAAITPTHQWGGLYNASRVQLATTTDGLTTAITSGLTLTYPIATVAAGAATTFTTTYTGMYYMGLLITAGTMPTVEGATGIATAATIPPILSGTSTGSLTTPTTFPTTAGTITPTAPQIYCYTT